MAESGRGQAGGGPAQGGRGKIAALLGSVVVVGALLWAMQAMVRHNALQNCLDSGRRDCGGGAGTP